MVDDGRLLGMAMSLGTPTYVFDAEAFRGRLRDVRGILGDGARLCFSIKANPFLIPYAAAEGVRLEACSPGELSLCEAYGVAPGSIVYSGVCKGEADVREALSYGVGVLTAESPRQLALIGSVAGSMGVRAPVLLRLSGKSQFGMTRGDLLAAVDGRGGMPSVDLVGIHYFVGTQRKRIRKQQGDLAMLAELVEELAGGHGWDPRKVEYGPGLPVPYFDGDDFSDTLAPARELAPLLAGVAEGRELTVEMGRFLAAGCGTYLARVVDLKDGDGLPYAFVDGGINHLAYHGQAMGMRVPPVRNLSAAASPAEGRRPGPWALCGSLCTTSDVLARELALPLAMGDVLAFGEAGAYSVTEGIYLFLSRDLPAVAIVDGDGERLARRRAGTAAINADEEAAHRLASLC